MPLILPPHDDPIYYMQDAKSKCPEIQSITNPLQVDQPGDDFAITEVADIGQGILTGIDEGKTIKNQAGRCYEPPLIVLQHA